MKKTVSFSLEEDIVKAIDEYKKDNNLSSRSVALERIVLSFNTLNEQYIREIIQKYIGNIPKSEKNFKVQENKTEPGVIDSAILDSYSSMPD